jgi:hypothetical protein
MSLNFGQFPTPVLPIGQNDKVVGYQLVGAGLIPTLAQYSMAQLAVAVGSSIPQAAFAALMLTWFNSLPTVLPGTPGILWNNGGTLAQS